MRFPVGKWEAYKGIIMLNKFKSNKGALLSFVTYSVLILLTAFGVGTYARSMNGNNQTRIQFELLKSQYNSQSCIENIFIEIKNTALGENKFLTHFIDTLGETPYPLRALDVGDRPTP